MIPPRPSLAIWAAIAILLILLSYLFTLALAAACIYFPFVLLTVSSGLNTLLLFLGGLVIGAIILWSLVPRRDRFEAPGPVILEREHPRLFAEIQTIAASLDEAVPSEVYLVPDLNAFVAERGGVFGFGSRRVMGLGLPLIRVLSVSQFRAVLAHEFGHYYGGDTRLWPLVHNARSSIARTLVNLSSDSLAEALSRIRIVGFLHYIAVLLLVGYWKIFLRITQAISRKHEYRADELAAYTADPQALAEGLRIIHSVSPLLPMYFQMEVTPALHAGFRPPIADGFAQFLTAPSIAKGIPQYLETQLRNSASDAYDTHPPLRDRIAALDRIPLSTQPVDSTPAIALLDDVPKAELELLEFMAPDAPVRKFQHLSWERIGAEAYLPAWRSVVNHHQALFAGYTIDRLPALVAKLKELAPRLPDPPGSLLTPEQRLDRAAALLWQAFAVAIHRNGWTLVAAPGELHFAKGPHRLEPPEILQQMRAAEISHQDWRQRCDALGIGAIPLAPGN